MARLYKPWAVLSYGNFNLLTRLRLCATKHMLLASAERH
jgi:hypothetical protein